MKVKSAAMQQKKRFSQFKGEKALLKCDVFANLVMRRALAFGRIVCRFEYAVGHPQP
jgi:hypothetical protein